MTHRTCWFGLVATFFLACGSLSAQEQGEKGDKDEDATFYRRFVKVRNMSQEKVLVFVQYRTYQKDQGKWVWFPDGAPKTKSAEALEIEPGTEVELKNLDQPLSASRARIWAQSDNLVWEQHRDLDLWVVPEIEEGDHRYKAASMETFTYFLAGLQDPAADLQNVNLPINCKKEHAQPRVVIVPPQPDLAPLDIFFPMPVDQVDPFPLIVVPPLPNVVIVREADLFVSQFRIDPSGNFSAMIGNRGPNTFRGGRRWSLFRSPAPGQPYRLVLDGWVERLSPTGFFQVWGSVAGLSDASRFIFALSPGDNLPENDVSAINFIAPPRADLAISRLELRNNTAFVTVTNNGPNDYRSRFRSVTLADQQRVMTVPTSQTVGFLPQGDSVVLQFPMRTNTAANNRLLARLSRGDANVINDFADVAVDGGLQPIGALAEFRVSNLRVDGRSLKGDIVCTKDGVRMPRQFVMSYETTGLFPRRNLVSGPLSTLPVGSAQTAAVSLPFDPATTSFSATLALDSARFQRESSTRFFGSGTGGTGAFDLAIVSFNMLGGRPVGLVRNVGSARYPGGDRWDISTNSAVGPRVLTSGNLNGLEPQEVQRVEFTGTIPPQQASMKLRLLSKNSGAPMDGNPNNDFRDIDLSVLPTFASLRVDNLQEVAGTARWIFTQTPPLPAQLTGGWEYEFSINGQKIASRSAAPGLQSIQVPPGGGAAVLTLFNTTPGGQKVVVASNKLVLSGNKSTPGGFGKIIVANDRVLPNSTFAWTFNVDPAGAQLQGQWVFKLVKDGIDVPGSDGVVTPLNIGTEQRRQLPSGGGKVFVQVMNFVAGSNTPLHNVKSNIHDLGGGKLAGSADLAVTSATLDAKTQVLKYRITNNGPDDYSGGRAHNVTGPFGFDRLGPVPAIAKNKFIDLQTDMTKFIKAMPANQPFAATIELTGSDATLVDDKRTSNSIITGGGGGGLVKKGSLDIGSISYNRASKLLTVTIINNTGDDYPSRFAGGLSQNCVVKVRIPEGGKEREVNLGGTLALIDPSTGQLTASIPNGASRQTRPTNVGNLPPGTMVRVEINGPGVNAFRDQRIQ